MEYRNRCRNVAPFHMVLRSRTNSKSKFESLSYDTNLFKRKVQQLHRRKVQQSKKEQDDYYNNYTNSLYFESPLNMIPPNAPVRRRVSKVNNQLSVDIDFEDASKQWNKNKTKLGNGVYKYKKVNTQQSKLKKSSKKKSSKNTSLDYDNTISLRNRIIYEHF